MSELKISGAVQCIIATLRLTPHLTSEIRASAGRSSEGVAGEPLCP